MTKIVPITCPGCKSPMYGKYRDTVFLCSNCGALHSRDGGIAVIEYEAGAFKQDAGGDKVYLPFWRAGVDFRIKSENVAGNTVSRIAGFIMGNANAGHIDMMLPAFQADPARYKDMAEKLTLGRPQYAPERIDLSVRREPCAVGIAMVDEMADFLFVTLEAEKPGVMQQLDYDLRVTSKKLVYLPYYKKGNDLVPGY